MTKMSLLAYLCAAFLLVGCQLHESEVTVQSLKDAEGPTSESWDPVLHISEDGLPRLTMSAAYLARYETVDSTYMVLSALKQDTVRVRVDIFDAQGDSSATVHSNRITYFERDRRFVAEGRVVVRAKDNRWLFSEHLAWTEASARVSTPGFATIRTPKETLSGYEFDADENLYDFSLKRVTGTLISDDE